MRNLYAVLEVPPAANAHQIRSAYRRMARMHHPDHTGGQDERFKEIAAAYEVLSDEKRRAEYDSQREVWLRARGAFPCSACGQGIRIPAGSRGAGRCARCKAPFETPPAGVPIPTESAPPEMPPLMSVIADRLREYGARVRSHMILEAANAAEQISDEVVAEVATRAVQGVRSGLQSLRNKMKSTPRA